jgi:hypothetical protein
VTFDGKIGMWPLVYEYAAKRNSRNRPKGAIELKTLTTSREVYREYLIDNVIPSIKRKWPSKRETIYIQQDNARPHVPIDDPPVLLLAKKVDGTLS